MARMKIKKLNTAPAIMLTLYNTLSKEKEALPDAERIKLFVCGPTVYDYAHIGHARTYIFFDFFAKYLRSQGYDVFYLQNITDIDDKIIKRAVEENKQPLEFAKFFTQAYKDDMRSLGIEMTSDKNEAKREGKILYAAATAFMPEIIDQVQRLIEKGYAYRIDGDGWYFDISKDADYGKLSGRNTLQAEDAVSRIDEAVGKRNKGDFCLWKFSKSGEPSWKSGIGDGRPGWHIEDTAISEKFFGPQYDIHGGGIDLKFPHHEAEIAQQESASGKKPFVKIWMHTGALLVDGKKMSKSLGNFITIRAFMEKYPPEVLRWMTLMHNYRMPLDYTEKMAEDARTNLNTIRRFLWKLEFNLKQETFKTKSVLLDDYDYSKFDAFIDDDMNTPEALGFVFKALNDANERLSQLDENALRRAIDFIKKVLKLFGVNADYPEIPQEIKELAEEMEQCRVNKQFEHSNRLREKINALGYKVENTNTPFEPFIYPG